MSSTKLPGTAVNVGGEVRICPALTLNQMKTLQPALDTIGKIKAAGSVLADEEMDAIMDVAHAALSRNYPDLQRNAVADLIDTRNAPELIKAALGASPIEPAAAE